MQFSLTLTRGILHKTAKSFKYEIFKISNYPAPVSSRVGTNRRVEGLLPAGSCDTFPRRIGFRFLRSSGGKSAREERKRPPHPRESNLSISMPHHTASERESGKQQWRDVKFSRNAASSSANKAHASAAGSFRDDKLRRGAVFVKGRRRDLGRI